MGREIRRVPPNWEHPKGDCGHGYDYLPLLDSTAEEDFEEWIRDFEEFKTDGKLRSELAKDHPNECPLGEPYRSFYWHHGGPPNPDYRRRAYEEPATWWQVYETVSEGTPVSPPFATPEELIEYLVENGDFWDQDRRARGDTVMDNRPWSREAATKFVMGAGPVPSMMINTATGEIKANARMLED